ncbi:BTAD domain-containing putative transcriptional regulator [Catellatospora sp. NPDC049609]|uniref:AfsR/SARP family transcriptional regulator n=1 Tax=Catellatospora sp. NPDC049609 TaxID=3155505 RepID=UPI00341E6D0B
MRFALRLLGSVEVDSSSAVRGVKPRALLATLALQPNRTVSLDLLAEALWEPSEVPRSAVANVRTYANTLRGALGRAGVELINQAGGYVLRVAAQRCDHLMFGELADAGRAALADGHAEQAVASLHAALDLWRGTDAAGGVPRLGPLHGWLGCLDQERLRASENLAEALLAAGDARCAVRELRRLLAVAPLRTRAWWLRMSAHHRLGEHDAVSTTFREATRVFHDELGLDPDPALRELYRTLLSWPPGGVDLPAPALS